MLDIGGYRNTISVVRYQANVSVRFAFANWAWQLCKSMSACTYNECMYE